MAKLFSVLILILLFGFKALAQIDVVNHNVNSFNITPEALCNVTLINQSERTSVTMEVKVMNMVNQPVMVVKTMPIDLSSGLNLITSSKIRIALTEYAKTGQADYIKQYKRLPSGRFSYCIKFSATNLKISENGTYCDEIDNQDLISTLSLINPDDKEVIINTNPLLVWTHNEPFSALGPGESFRLILVELEEGQKAEAGLQANLPIFLKEGLMEHQVLYPYDAKKLEKGARYGWQVQKVFNRSVIEKAEAFEFSIEKEEPVVDNKYAVLKKSLDGAYYLASNRKVFFKFDEEYASGNFSCSIYDSRRNEIKPVTSNENDVENKITFKSHGYNQCEIDLTSLNIKNGLHTLEVTNEKGEVFLLKFYLP